MRVCVLLASAVATLLVVGSANAATNLVSQGTFDPAPDAVPSTFKTVSSGNKLSSTSAWTVKRGSVDLIGGYWNGPGAGQLSVDLNGTAPGTIQQDINFAHAGTYVLSFKISGNPDNFKAPVGSTYPPEDVKQLLVSIGDQQGILESYTVTAAPHDLSGHDLLSYQLVTLKFSEDTAGSDALTIASYKTPGAFGAVVGDFSIAYVPEPATWAMMLIGFGGLGAALRMNRRRTLAVV